MSLVLQISDPHFGTVQAPVAAALAALAREKRPDALILSGDITQRATRRQFAAARRYVDGLAIPRVLTLPGNHDIPLLNLWARLFNPYGRYRQAFGDDLEPELSSPEYLIIGVNTTRAARHKDGEVSAAQIERVASRLGRAEAAQLRIVVTHQPTHVVRARDAHNLLHGHEAAVRAWVRAGADLLLGGHIHLPYVSALHEHDAELPRRAWCVQAGTALSSRIRREAPNSVHLIRIGSGPPSRCQIERWDYDAASTCFVCAQEHALLLDRGVQ